jgi:hypothetical protein
MSVGELSSLLPPPSAPSEPASSKVVRLFQPKIEMPSRIAFAADEKPDESEDARTRRYRELKERAERAPDTLDADDWATIKIFESGLRPIRGRG